MYKYAKSMYIQCIIAYGLCNFQTDILFDAIETVKKPYFIAFFAVSLTNHLFVKLGIMRIDTIRYDHIDRSHRYD